MLGDFALKMQNWEGKSISDWKYLSRNEMWLASDNHNNIFHTCAKGLLDSVFDFKRSYYKISFLTKLPQISYI